MTKLEALAKDCIENHTHRLVDKPTKQDIYLREESIYISGYRECERRNKKDMENLATQSMILIQRNAELENENAELKADNDARKFAMAMSEKVEEQWQKEKCELIGTIQARDKTIQELEKENAELKKENKVLAQNLEDTEILNKTYEKKNEELKEKLNFSTQYYQGEKAKEQLTNAKEIINDCVRELQNILFYKMRNKERIASALDKAEQFLKDCEVNNALS